MNKLLKQQKKNQRYKIKTKSKIIKNKRGGSKLNKKRKYKLTKKHGGGTGREKKFICECRDEEDTGSIAEYSAKSFESPPNPRTKEGKLKKRGSTLSLFSILWDERYVKLDEQHFRVYSGSEKEEEGKHKIPLENISLVKMVEDDNTKFIIEYNEEKTTEQKTMAFKADSHNECVEWINILEGNRRQITFQRVHAEAEETRKANDGKWYTWDQFVEYYQNDAKSHWYQAPAGREQHLDQENDGTYTQHTEAQNAQHHDLSQSNPERSQPPRRREEKREGKGGEGKGTGRKGKGKGRKGEGRDGKRVKAAPSLPLPAAPELPAPSLPLLAAPELPASSLPLLAARELPASSLPLPAAPVQAAQEPQAMLAARSAEAAKKTKALKDEAKELIKNVKINNDPDIKNLEKRLQEQLSKDHITVIDANDYKYDAARAILRAIKENIVTEEKKPIFEGLINSYAGASTGRKILYAFIDLMLTDGLLKNEKILNFIKKDISNQEGRGKKSKKKSKKKNKKTLK